MLPNIRLNYRHISDAMQGINGEVIGIQGPVAISTAHTRRNMWEYGYRYGAMLDGDFTRTATPAFIKQLRNHAITQLRHIVGPDLPQHSEFTNCIISEYTNGNVLEPHVDVHENKFISSGKAAPFFFGEYVVGVILVADEQGKLYIQHDGGQAKPAYNPRTALHIPEREGMAYVLCGPLRREPFVHGVTPIDRRRVSVTFRTVHFR